MVEKDSVRAEVEIDAPVETVWQVLTDLDGYGDWNPFTPAAESTLAIGDPIHLRVRLFGRRTIPWTERISRNAPYMLGWDLVLGHRRLLYAERTQVLEAVDAHRTHYLTVDRFSGHLAPLVLWLFGRSMSRGFADCAQALKKAAETKTRMTRS
ncbi:MAG: SRPBCC domain-containing protein [Acidobacteriota bacterium]